MSEPCVMWTMAGEAVIKKCPQIYELEAENAKLKKSNERLRNRDLNASIQLCYDNGNNPFAREDLKVVDVGVADNCYVVESNVVEKLKAENAKLKEDIDLFHGKLAKANVEYLDLRAENAKLKVLLSTIEARMQSVFSDIANYRASLKEPTDETKNG